MLTTKEFGGVIIEILFPPEVSDEVYTRHLNTFQDQKEYIRHFTSKQGEYIVTIKTQDTTVQRRREAALYQGNKKYFHGLIEQIVQGLENKDEVISLDMEYEYMTPEQARNTVELLSLVNYDNHAPDIIKSMKEYIVAAYDCRKPISLIDLGVGPAIKPISLYDALNRHFTISEYIGIDASQCIIDLAQKDIQKYNFDLPVHFHKLRFQDVSEDPTKLVGRISSDQKVYLFLGATYTNFRKEEMKEFITSIMHKGDVLFVQVDGVKDLSDAHTNIVGKYKRDPLLLQSKKSLHGKKLFELGCADDSLDYEFVYDDDNNILMGIGTLKDIPETILPRLKAAGLQKGQKFCLNYHRKFTEQSIKKELESFGLQVEVKEMHKHRSYLAMCRKV